MIYINDFQDLQKKIIITYNPVSDMAMSLDVISDPSHHSPHITWAEDVFSRFSRKEKELFRTIESKTGGWFRLDDYIDQYALDNFSLDNPDKLIDFIKDPDSWKGFPESLNYETIVFFLETYCRNFFIDIIEEHRVLIESAIGTETSFLQTLEIKEYIQRLNPRVSSKKDVLVMEKQYDSSFNSVLINQFYIKLSLFSFPHLVIDDRHTAGIFSLCKDLPFRGNDFSLKGSNLISTKAFALSDRTRLEMLFMLSKQPMTQKELTQKTGLAKSTVSRHINILIDSGILYSSENERNVKLFIKTETIETMSAEILSWLNISHGSPKL